MGLFRTSVFFLVLYLLQGSNTSLIKLNNSGYEDIIFAIHPDVQEDENIIKQIEDMVTAASTYLFKATEKRFFFKTVSILIPETWKANSQYKRPRLESYTHADVLVAPPTLPGRDEPYTRQFTECGEKGEFIHFTPDFLLGKKEKEYGPSGRVFVHEWAHLRWGVFDEYNEDEPFYSSSSKKIEATRCSTGITGTNKVYWCQGNSCVTRVCRLDSKTKLYEKDCQFFPNKVQNEKASIMFMQSIDSVTEFCNAKNHNREAPSLQNKKCESRSIWEVISNSEDFNNTVPMEETPPPPVFSLLRISERVVCLVLDKSGSMSTSQRLQRMNQAAKHFLLQTIENGSWVGLVQFESIASVKSNLVQITSNSEREELVKKLPTQASGGTSICSGIEAAFQVIKRKFNGTEGSEIALLTDGEDNTVKSCLDTVKQSGAIVHLIALGKNAEEAVKEMSQITGGHHLLATDNLENNGLINAFMALESGNTDVSQKAIQVRVGIWTYSLQAKAISETLTVTITSRASSSSVPPITVNTKMNKDTNTFPSPMIVYAEVQQGFLPVLGATVTAFIESKSGTTNTLELLDNGAGADSFKNDGVYSRYFTNYTENGRYSLKVRVQGGTNTVTKSLMRPLNKALYIPGWVVDGVIEGNPPRQEANDTQATLENFSRTATGGAFVVSNVPNNPTIDMYPPSQITDLEATFDEDEITLTWTAPGDDFDVGTAQEYIIRISGSILDLRDNFDDALQVNTTGLSPKEANSKETFMFRPGNISDENATHVFIAIKSVDKGNLTSKTSNIAQVALFIPQADTSPDDNPQNPSSGENQHTGVNIIAVVFLVIGAVVVIWIIVGTTKCFVSKKKTSSRPRTGF
ncbi:PREDICTED: calcium-activated chloride channel regulator 4-like [Elephantulus edwardii]|uniref:calcium-activated chloride channel regulator 4-like n=1 Tax=Elephantulus edwardii TaxID=28737 RepID=UPI0003F0CE14|nr:PREDICTED: calcium-activated chloride channel regulator 4-like [Elephantulus edwardii]